MKVKLNLPFPKTQTKANDCWYACIQMLVSAKAGAKTKTAGNKAQQHRGGAVLGRTLSFDSVEGREVMRDNNLKRVDYSIDLTNMDSLHNTIQANGPLIVGCKFGIFNTQGHFFVIYGCDTVKDKVYIYDPFWAHGKTTKDWAYITKYIWRDSPNANVPGTYSVIASN